MYDTVQEIFSEEKFFRYGFNAWDLSHLDVVSRLDILISKILEGGLSEPFHFACKYPGSYDFRPSVIEYDPLFLDVIREVGVIELLKENFGKGLALCHVQLRVAESRGSGYAGWHRDSYYTSDGAVGNIPPAVKLIYYPKLSFAVEDQLKIAAGSHRLDFGSRFVDRFLIGTGALSEIKTITNDRNNWVLFDTSALHATCPVRNNKWSPRLIYTFLNSKLDREYPFAKKIAEYMEEHSHE